MSLKNNSVFDYSNSKNRELMDIERLLDRAYDGLITSEELADVIDKIQKYYAQADKDSPHTHSLLRILSDDDIHIHTLLQILGYAGAFGAFDFDCDVNELKKLVEKFLIFPKDSSVSTTALDVLCNDWNLTAEYIDQIKSYIKGVEWDKDMDVRVRAMCVAGEYIRESNDKECLGMLLEIFNDEQEGKYIRELAYDSISIAIGNHQKESEWLDIDTFPQNSTARETIARAYELLNEK